MDIHFTDYGSREWQAARELRHALFFKQLDLPLSTMEDEQEAQADHLVAVENAEVAGYGRLFDRGNGTYQISQMAVSPERQGQGIGRLILQHLLHEAERNGADTIELSARVSAIDFYTKAGFVQRGEVFASARTGVAHVNMVLRENGVS